MTNPEKKDTLDLILEQSIILAYANSLAKDLLVFHNISAPTPSQLRVLERNPFLYKIRSLLEHELFLNYGYLFTDSQNDRTRLPKTMKAIIDNYDKWNWIKPVSKAHIEECSQRLTKIIETKIIKETRDKAVGHKDLNWLDNLPKAKPGFYSGVDQLCIDINDTIFINLNSMVITFSRNVYNTMPFADLFNKLISYQNQE